MAGCRRGVNRSTARQGYLKWTDSDGLAAPDVIAGGGTRTHTDLRPGAFEAPSSTIPTLRRAGHCLKRLKRSHRTYVSNARMAPSATRGGRRPERGSRRPAGRGASITRVRSLGTYQGCFRLKARTTIATWWAGPAGAIGRRLPN